MSTGLDTFDKTVQESNLWLKDIMDRLNTEDRHHAYSTLRAVLHALRDRIGAESAAAEIESIARRPVSKGSTTGWRSAMPGARDSSGRR